MAQMSPFANRRSDRRTMRAAQLMAPRRIEIVEAPLPDPSAGEVRVQIEGCGVCASNIPPYEGREWFQYPMAPGQLGHEGWGTVDAIGEGVTQFEIGDRVACLSNHAYAEADVVGVDSVVRLPKGLADKPFPGEPLACALNIYERAGIRPGDTVAIVGIGFLGALLTQLAARERIRVIAIGRRESALDSALHAGAAECLAMDDHWSVVSKVQELTSGKGADVVIECVGKQGPLDLSGDLVREMGRLIIAGYHQDGLRQVNLQMWNWKGLDVINAHEREHQRYISGMARAADAVATAQLDPFPLFTHDFPLERLGDALEATIHRPKGFMKALIRR